MTPLEELSAVVQRSARREEWFLTARRNGWNLNNGVMVWPWKGGFRVQLGLGRTQGYAQDCETAELAVRLAELLA